MTQTADTARYSRVAAALHWLIAALILTNIALGWIASLTEGAWHRITLDPHKAIGICVLALSLARLAWRLYCPPPELAPGKAAWERPLAAAVHAAFYFLIIATPLAGWWLSSAVPTPHPIMIFGLEVPMLPVAKGMAFAKGAGGLHEKLAWTLAALVALHVAAAVKHTVVDRDGLLSRMSLLRR